MNLGPFQINGSPGKHHLRDAEAASRFIDSLSVAELSVLESCVSENFLYNNSAREEILEGPDALNALVSDAQHMREFQYCIPFSGAFFFGICFFMLGDYASVGGSIGKRRRSKFIVEPVVSTFFIHEPRFR